MLQKHEGIPQDKRNHKQYMRKLEEHLHEAQITARVVVLKYFFYKNKIRIRYKWMNTDDTAVQQLR